LLSGARSLLDPPDPSKDPDGFDRWARRWVVPPDRTADADAYRAWIERVGTPPNRKADPEASRAWFVEFLDSAPPAKLDLAGLTGGPTGGIAVGVDDMPVPSGFGPYGLSRAAGASGGHYVLWSWSKGGRGDAFRYDYAKLNRMPPDLRARSEILADLPTRVLAHGLQQVWADLADAKPALVSETPPWRLGRGAAVTGLLSELYLVGILHDAADRDADVASGAAGFATINRAIERLDDVMKAAGPAKDDIDRRLQADADLLHHALEMARFHVKEYMAAATAIPKTFWKGKPAKEAYLPERDWVAPADDSDSVETVGAPPLEAALGEALVASRKAFLEKYRSTPYGAIVARNRIQCFDLKVWDYKPGPGAPPPPKGKGSSTGKAPPATGGSAGAPGATTGK
jgi:hypothetical protein